MRDIIDFIRGKVKGLELLKTVAEGFFFKYVMCETSTLIGSKKIDMSFPRLGSKSHDNEQRLPRSLIASASSALNGEIRGCTLAYAREK